MQNVIINGNTYGEVQKVQIPLSDGSGNADFIDTTGATAKAENIDKGYNAYVNGELVVGSKEAVSSPLTFEKIGTYSWSNPAGTATIIEGCVSEIKAYCEKKRLEMGLNTEIRLGILVKADEKPTSASGIKANLFAVTYNYSNGTMNPYNPILTVKGAYYGGVDGWLQASVSASGSATDEQITFQAQGELQCETCTIYGVDINF